jgi:uncharacterized RDD family membrane protein YckC
MEVNKVSGKNESPEKGITKELDLSELKHFLAKEEEEVERKKRSLNEQIKKESVQLPIEKEKSEEHKKPLTPEELRNERRLYWQEQKKQEQLKKTPFHYYPAFFYGGFWLRFFAYLIDLVVINSINRLIVSSLFVMARLPMSMESFSLFTLSKLTVFLLYFILITKLTNGQTIGKIIFGLRVVCFKEKRLSWKTVIVREGFGRYILKTISILYLSILFTKRNQHMIDLFSDTSVVLEKTINAMDWYESNHLVQL